MKMIRLSENFLENCLTFRRVSSNITVDAERGFKIEELEEIMCDLKKFL